MSISNLSNPYYNSRDYMDFENVINDSKILNSLPEIEGRNDEKPLGFNEMKNHSVVKTEVFGYPAIAAYMRCNLINQRTREFVYVENIISIGDNEFVLLANDDDNISFSRLVPTILCKNKQDIEKARKCSKLSGYDIKVINSLLEGGKVYNRTDGKIYSQLNTIELAKKLSLESFNTLDCSVPTKSNQNYELKANLLIQEAPKNSQNEVGPNTKTLLKINKLKEHWLNLSRSEEPRIKKLALRNLRRIGTLRKHLEQHRRVKFPTDLFPIKNNKIA